jgi:hypothetical protein
MIGSSETARAGALERRQVLAGLAAGVAGAAGGLFRADADAAITRRTVGNVCPVGDATTDPNGYRVFRFGGPPANDSLATTGAYQSWPVTDSVTSQDSSVTSTWTGGGMMNNWPINAWFYVWANRKSDPGQTIVGPNPIQNPPILDPDNGRECRVSYTTYAKANAATQCLVRYWLGRSDYMDPWLAIGGTSASDFVFYAELAADPATYFTTAFSVANAQVTTTYMVMIDRPWLPSAPDAAPGVAYQRANMMRGTSLNRLPANMYAPGVFLDYEVNDGRSTGAGAFSHDPDGSLNFLKRLHADIHATVDSNGQPQSPAQFAFFTNPLNGPSMPNSGLDGTNLPTICRSYVDYMSILLWHGNTEDSMLQSYIDQIRLLKNTVRNPLPFSKLFMVFDLSQTTASEAQMIHTRLVMGALPTPTSPPAVMFWNDGAANCVTATDTLISLVLTGNTSAV